MGLATHLGGLHGDNIEDGAVDGEQHVQSALQVILLKFVGQVGAVQGVVGANTVRWSSLRSHVQRYDEAIEGFGVSRAGRGRMAQKSIGRRGLSASRSAAGATGVREREPMRQLPRCRRRHCLLPRAPNTLPHLLHHTTETVERNSCPFIRHGRPSSPPSLPPPNRRSLFLGRPQDTCRR